MYEHLSRVEALEKAEALCHRCIDGELSLAVLSVELMKLRGLDADDKRALIAGAEAGRACTPRGITHEAKTYAASVAWMAAYLSRRSGPK